MVSKDQSSNRYRAAEVSNNHRLDGLLSKVSTRECRLRGRHLFFCSDFTLLRPGRQKPESDKRQNDRRWTATPAPPSFPAARRCSAAAHKGSVCGSDTHWADQ